MSFLESVFTEARTHYAWTSTPVSDDQLRELHAVAKWPPTGGNAQCMRLVFVRTPDGKQRLKPALAPMNVDKMMTAPVTAIVAYDTAWYEQLGRLAPSQPGRRDAVAAMPADERDRLATLNALLQAGYLILAARAIGLDCGPMGGFDRSKVDAEFFADGAWRSLLLVNLGHGDPAKVFPRQPRLDFADVCRLE